ncbi:MAG: hypothetical protein WC812_00760 [Candidatus Pacearchaeota archaeon]|jgi:hypothetical protein
MNLIRRFDENERTIKNLLDDSRMCLRKREKYLVFSSNLFIAESMLKDYSGKHKDYFMKKLNKLKDDEKTSLGYFHCYDMP